MGRCPEPRVLLAVLAALAVAPGCARPRQTALERVRRAGVLRWGGDIQGGEPYVFEDPARPGRLTGFEVELADALGQKLGVRTEFVQNDWSNLVPSLERGSFDMIMNGLEVTPARAGRLLFSRPYYVFTERLVARVGDGRIRGLDSLRGLRVGALASSLGWDLLVRAGARPVPYEGVEEPYIDLERGRTDAVLLDDIIADRYGLARPTLRAVADVATGYYAIGVRRGDEDLRLAIDEALAKVARSGELDRILGRWQIGGERQGRLASWSDADQRALQAAGAPARVGSGHLLLFLQGAVVTLLVTAGAMLLAVPLGLGIALVRFYGPRWAGQAVGWYVEILRGTPVLLQLYVLYYGLAGLVRVDAFTAAVLGLGLNRAADESEIYRAAISAVPRGQTEAALALGMSLPLALRRIVLPQALRVALPGVTNDFIALLKDSSLVSVITVVELTKRMTVTAVDTRGWLLPGLLCAGLYFAMSYPLSRLARRLEARLGGEAAGAPLLARP